MGSVSLIVCFLLEHTSCIHFLHGVFGTICDRSQDQSQQPIHTSHTRWKRMKYAYRQGTIASTMVLSPQCSRAKLEAPSQPPSPNHQGSSHASTIESAGIDVGDDHGNGFVDWLWSCLFYTSVNHRHYAVCQAYADVALDHVET